MIAGLKKKENYCLNKYTMNKIFSRCDLLDFVLQTMSSYIIYGRMKYYLIASYRRLQCSKYFITCVSDREMYIDNR
jgi:hypothetical protein